MAAKTNEKERGVINQEKLEEFDKLLKTASIQEKDKKALKFAIEFVEGKHDIELSSRTFMLHGEPGVGKTYIIEKFVAIFNLPIIYAGCAHIKHPQLIECKDLEKALEELSKQKECIVFLDDLGYLSMLSNSRMDRSMSWAQFMKIVDYVKSSKDRILLFSTTNSYYSIDEPILDRIDVPIEVDIPKGKDKLAFLIGNYSNVLNQRQISFIAKRSFGYNFRDLPEVIKMAYREGNGRIARNSLNKTMSNFTPHCMQIFEKTRDPEYNFSHVIGKDAIKRELYDIIAFYRHKHFSERLGLKRHNLLIFDGPVGTGKTFMAEAFAGELKFPMLILGANECLEYGPAHFMYVVSKFSTRFENCVIVIDEAEKLLGKQTLGDDTPLDGYLNQIFDGLVGSTKALVIIIVNNIQRFGMGLSDRFLNIKFELPDRMERREFFRRAMKKAYAVADIEVDFDDLARMADGMSFRDMEKVCNSVFYKVIQGQKSVTNFTFNEAIKNIKPDDSMNTIYG